MKDLEFQKLYQRFFSQVYRHTSYLLAGNGQVAEEITQETFIRLYTSPPLTQENLPGWLMKVSTNLAYNYLKSDKHRQARENRAGFSDPAVRESDLPEETYLRNQQILAVKEVLETLGEKDRICLLLRFSGFSYAEIAEAAGVSRSSVGTILARAQARFKKEFLLRNGGGS